MRVCARACVCVRAREWARDNTESGGFAGIVAMDGLQISQRNVARLPATMPTIEAAIIAADRQRQKQREREKEKAGGEGMPP